MVGYTITVTLAVLIDQSFISHNNMR